MNGVIIINKPSGLTSSDVVVRVRNYFRKNFNIKVKVGHLGTLDPGGLGVLPITIGKATRLFDAYLKSRKTYVASICFGALTDTLDSYGTILQQSDITPTEDEVKQAVSLFLGKIYQVPPQYSAVKIGGKKAYEIARGGKEIELPIRCVEIYDIKILRKLDELTYEIQVDCEGGTYVRSLIRDIAEKLNTVAYMGYIIRTKCGSFDISQSVLLTEQLENHIINTEDCLTNYIKIDITIVKNDLLNGRPFEINAEDGEYVGFIENKLFGIINIKNKQIEVLTRFWIDEVI